MAITVKELKAQLSEVDDTWLAAAYEGEGIGLTIKPPDYDWATSNPDNSTWIETGPPN